MSEEKSEAQIRNEEEVHRIMMERGYSPTSNKKRVKKVFNEDFPFGSIIAGVVGVAIIVGGWIFLQNYIFKDDKKAEISSYDNVSSYSDIGSIEENEELMNFQTCLKAINTSEIAADDNEFWDKYISRYEQTVACYDEHPTVADSSEKATFQERLNEARTQDNRYRNNMSKIDAELAKSLADIDARSKKWDEELARRQQETQAQKEATNAENKRRQDEYEAQQKAQKEAEERAKQEKETQCAAYAGKTKEELADNDSEVKSARNTYNQASSNYSSVYRNNAAAYSNVVLTTEQRARVNEKIAEAKSKMDAAQLNYDNIRNSKLSYYSQILNSCK